MKLIYLGLVAAALGISAQEYPASNKYQSQPSYSNKYDGYDQDDHAYGTSSYKEDGYDYDDGYDKPPKYGKPSKGGYGKDDGYGKQPKDGYGKDDGYKPKPGYGKDDGYKPKPGYGKDDGYGKPPKDGYPTTTPGPTENPTKKHFDQFYDNLKLCKAENTLEQCFISSRSLKDCTSDTRINTCTTLFVDGLCGDIHSAVTGSYDNGYFKADVNTCFDAALADSLLVYNKLIQQTSKVKKLSQKFDNWSFTTIKLALASTRNHADCVIKSFFNYLSGCAANRVLRPKDKRCLDGVLTGKCHEYLETADGWNWKNVDSQLNDLLFPKLIQSLKKKYGSAHKIIDDEVKEEWEDLKTSQGSQTLTSTYDFDKHQSSIKASTEILAKDLETQFLDPSEGVDAAGLFFHFPHQEGTKSEQPTLWKDKTGKKATIYDTCKNHFKNSRKEFLEKSIEKCVERRDNSWIKIRFDADGNYEVLKTKNGVKAFKDGNCNDEKDDATFKFGCDPRKLNEENGSCDKQLNPKVGLAQAEFIPDKCYSYNGYSIKFLETGEEKAVALSGAKTEGLKTTVTASWTELHSCNSHLTQWRQSVACCKSYQTVLKEFQSAWDKNYGRDYGQDRYSGPKSEPRGRPDRPCVVPDTYKSKDLIFEKILISKSGSGELLTGDDDKITTLPKPVPIPQSAEESAPYSNEGPAQYNDGYNNEVVNVGPPAILLNNGAGGPVDTPKNPHYLAYNKAYTRLCNSLQLGWDVDTIVPIVSTQCFPQACVLAQLARCLDIPEKETGYDYVAQPQPGYPGYRPSYYQRVTLALDSVNTGVLAVSGFVAGAAVVVIAQMMLKKQKSDPLVTTYI